MGNELVATEILQTIGKNPRITPQEIAKETDVNAQYVRNTLQVLTELKLVMTPVRGVYLITDLGRHLLSNLDQDIAVMVDGRKGEKRRNKP